MADLSTSNASTLSAIDLSRLPFPDLLIARTYEEILAEMLTDVNNRAIAKTGKPYIFHEADPAFLVLEACAYRRHLDLKDYQNQVRQMLIAFAEKAMLDHLGANPDFKCPRLVVVAEDLTATPPIAAVMEDDESYRRRLTLTNEGYTSAGSSGAYLFHALSVSGDIRDVSVTSPNPGEVLITLLTHSNNGVAGSELLDQATDTLSAETVRPLCDSVTVQGASITEYAVITRIVTYPGADVPSTLKRAKAAQEAYCEAHYRLGHDITRSGLSGAATVEGVQNVFIDSPATDLEVALTAARRVSSVSISHVDTKL